jgi:hypothetical protein
MFCVIIYVDWPSDWLNCTHWPVTAVFLWLSCLIKVVLYQLSCPIKYKSGISMKRLWLDFRENILFSRKFWEIFVKIERKQNFAKFRIFAKIGKGIFISTLATSYLANEKSFFRIQHPRQTGDLVWFSRVTLFVGNSLQRCNYHYYYYYCRVWNKERICNWDLLRLRFEESNVPALIYRVIAFCIQRYIRYVHTYSAGKN